MQLNALPGISYPLYCPIKEQWLGYSHSEYALRAPPGWLGRQQAGEPDKQIQSPGGYLLRFWQY
jgi:hypothetical protein